MKPLVSIRRRLAAVSTHPVAWQLAVLAFFAVAAAYFLWPVVFSGKQIADVGFGDRLFDARLMRYEFDWLAGRTSGGLFDIDFFFPHPNALATTDPTFGLVLITLPLRIFTDDYLLLSNLAAYLSFVLCGHAAYLLGRQLTRSEGAGIFAGVAFAFCQYRFHQIDHSGILQMQWLVYALSFVHRLGEAPSLRRALPIAVFVFLHGIASNSIALYSAPLLPLVVLFAAHTARRGQRLRVLALATAAGTLAAAALFPFYRPFLLNREVYAIVRDLDEVRMYAGQVQQLWAVPRYNLAYGESHSADLGLESLTFPGWSVLVLLAAGTATRWTPHAAGQPFPRAWAGWLLELSIGFARLAAFAAAVLLCFRWTGATWVFVVALAAVLLLRGSRAAGLGRGWRSLPASWLYAGIGFVYLLAAFGPEVTLRGERLGAGLWMQLIKLPGYAQVRTPARFYFVSCLCAAILSAQGLKRVLERVPSLWLRRAVAAAVILATMAEMNVRIPGRPVVPLAAAPRVYSWLAAQPGRGAIVELPINDRERERMFFANLHKRPTVDAESSFNLPSIGWMTPGALTSSEGLTHLAMLRTAGLEYLILHTQEAAADVIDAHRRTLAAAGATRVAQVDEAEVWRFASRGAFVPFAPAGVETTLGLPALAVAHSPLVVTVRLTARQLPVFDPAHRRLFLKVTGLPVAGGEQRLTVHLAPPILIPGQPQSFPLSIALGAGTGVARARFEVADEAGVVWLARDAPVELR